MVNVALADKDFHTIKECDLVLQVNTAPTREHVSEIKRSIRTTKERTGCTTSEFPFHVF